MTASFDRNALEALAGVYPNRPGLLRHEMRGHPLLTLKALVALAQRIRPVDAEYNRADLPIGVDPAATPANGLSAAETIRSIERCGSWMVLKFIEQDPAYRALLDEALAPLRPLVGAVTGEMLKTEGFIFISSPGAVTPFHFDPEHNILLQIRGSKTMTVFPAGDEELASGERHEAFHQGGHRNLPWNDAFAARGEPFALAPGDAIYVPVKAPHWVKNGPEPSISLSITWRSEWSFHEEYAHGFNRLLRRAGLNPSLPRAFPSTNLAKSAAYRALRKVKTVLPQS
ncbi:MAG TPA: cupin-like domain-containing protein [Allosphingosinicella sp.]|jgi:oxalate decarboxylase/phosphoglucose isomerase-like protein (cupin superfamily)